ncbi:MAG TPA: hypothetical protein VKK31_12600 [Thermoanaerobaculia bacterium]|nr:hypothetical protein [Thermoanaerobaculia bacterium]
MNFLNILQMEEGIHAPRGFTFPANPVPWDAMNDAGGLDGTEAGTVLVREFFRDEEGEGRGTSS